jgi:N4-gp56 family major capsid protein
VDVNGVAYSGTFTDGTAVAAWSNTPTKISDTDTAAGSGNRYLCANSGGADALTATDLLTPQLITRMKIKAELASPRIDPVEYKGKTYYILLVHPWTLADLRDNATFAQALRDAWWRGEDNPLFSAADLVWDNVIVISHKYSPFLDISVAGYNFTATGSGTQYAVDTFRSLLCGKQAAVLAKCEEGPKWEEKSFDYGNKWAISCGWMGGIHKPMFNSKEYGVIACDHAATAQ